jgi:hypothetical protein
MGTQCKQKFRIRKVDLEGFIGRKNEYIYKNTIERKVSQGGGKQERVKKSLAGKES